MRRARALIGCRFRPQGRDAATGLDCLGLVARALDWPADRLPADYRLSGDHWPALLAGLDRLLRPIAPQASQAGDVLLFEIAPLQPHLAIATGPGIIHADASAGRVVERPEVPAWPIRRVYRANTEQPCRGTTWPL